MFVELQMQLDWFERAGVDRWNFAVLKRADSAQGGRDSMIGHDRRRDRDEVLRAAGWAWAKNLKEQLDVYVRPARGRPWPVVFLDDVPEASARSLCDRYSALLVETSKGSFQLWIATKTSLGEAERAAAQRALIAVHGGDPRSVSGEHWCRAVGYRNRKPGRGDFVVKVLHAMIGGERLDTDALKAAPAAAASAAEFASARPWIPGSAGDDESRREWGWVCGWLESGGSETEALRRLLARCVDRGKPDAERYARHTVTRAAASVAARTRQRRP